MGVRAAKPYGLDLWNWVLTGITPDMERVMDEVFAGAPLTEARMRILCRGIERHCDFSQAARSPFDRTRRETSTDRVKRFISPLVFLENLFNRNGRLPGRRGQSIVNHAADWTPKIPSVYAPNSQYNHRYPATETYFNENAAQIYESEHFNEDDLNIFGLFNEYSNRLVGSDASFDETSADARRTQFNEYSGSIAGDNGERRFYF